ncbi:MAG: oxygen-independent coproporphyrinogen III oxidase [Lachnospiraceae bacterium]|nr:oxygen-independent coproporphyrinogen III oxidase [Lachnospiraceae bacterium]
MKKELELYLHIPFCERKCAYCDFLSGPAKESDKEQYVDALIKEIKSYAGKMDAYEISTIFIGGGTPSSLEAVAIVRIMEAVYQTFQLRNRDRFGKKIEEHAKDAEITIECNPGTITREKADAYLACGINRMSMGLQSTVNEELKMLGRIHTYEEFLHNYQLVRDAGFVNVNLDLMSALPGQTIKTWEETLEKVLALKPEHISAYSLIIEEGTPFEREYGEDGPKRDLIPDEDTDRAMYELTKVKLEEAGYYRYEISNYAKPGYECEHNIGYWKRVDYLGLGVGASSLLEKERFHNTNDRDVYIRNCENPEQLREDVERLDRKDEMEEFMFLGLRLCKGINKAEFAKQFGCSIEEIYGPVIQKLISESLLHETQENLSLTPHGLDISNAVFAEFLL